MNNRQDELRTLMEGLKSLVLRLGGLVEEQVAKSMEAFKEYDVDVARTVIRDDRRVNELEVKIEEECISILSGRSLQGRDLRFITAAIKINDQLETISDMATNICERVLELTMEPRLSSKFDIAGTGAIARGMLNKSLDAFVSENTVLANNVRKDDDKVDALCSQAFGELLEHMAKNPDKIPTATRIMLVSKYIERIADHAENIAEMVIHMVEGKIIRHTVVEEEIG